ncbi:MAG: hypothetical protein CVV64_20130 [Candidatus Wallbacteria bacterium HGW-Wallbacteria-1]|jgi:hypothetical protein|uniref:Uncharacterized protein n=1 Tax=Candidatus Wallbacteria bacterium HGW-Wallbacteria-1 TaxID=2013854 RepID=A0A2N1PIM2_9BACT|nr:MAG: hypothetical protein CVV64_20130 [Candidatus Wallbacteria bacterium HGW-Wallbacteria-1]
MDFNSQLFKRIMGRKNDSSSDDSDKSVTPETDPETNCETVSTKPNSPESNSSEITEQPEQPLTDEMADSGFPNNPESSDFAAGSKIYNMASDFTAYIKGHAKIDLNILEKVKGFVGSSLKLASEIDEHLMDENSDYVVNSFSITAKAGIPPDLSLLIRFDKTKAARSRALGNQQVSILNPETDQIINISKSTLDSKPVVRVRDPLTGKPLLIDSKTLKIIKPEKMEKRRKSATKNVNNSKVVTPVVLKKKERKSTKSESDMGKPASGTKKNSGGKKLNNE